MRKKKYTGTLKERWKQAQEEFKAKFSTEEWREYCRTRNKRYRQKYIAPKLTPEQKSFIFKQQRRDEMMKDPRRAIWLRAKYRAGYQNLEFTITPEDFTIPDVCPLLGIPIILAATVKPGYVVRDNSPSLDRKDSSKGYIPGNVAVISFKANRAKGPLSIDELNNLSQSLYYYLNS